MPRTPLLSLPLQALLSTVLTCAFFVLQQGLDPFSALSSLDAAQLPAVVAMHEVAEAVLGADESCCDRSVGLAPIGPLQSARPPMSAVRRLKARYARLAMLPRSGDADPARRTW